MMGDQSQSKREDGSDIGVFLLADLYGDSKLGTVQGMRQALGRGIGLAIAQGRVANARELVRHRAGRLVVIGAGLHRQPPAAQAALVGSLRAWASTGP